jgi:hypothetical protein
MRKNLVYLLCRLAGSWEFWYALAVAVIVSIVHVW